VEDYAYILDFLPRGHPAGGQYHAEPVAFAVGGQEFKLLELNPKPEVKQLLPGEKVYIGKEPEMRDKILHVKRRVSATELTNAAQSELPFVLKQIVNANPDRFVKFFNEAQPVSTRFHMLELLPGLGKKTMWKIIEERKIAPFKDFADLAKRVTTLHKPDEVIAKRIQDELEDEQQKYSLFVHR
jgi:putative nucleotide binding protein